MLILSNKVNNRILRSACDVAVSMKSFSREVMQSTKYTLHEMKPYIHPRQAEQAMGEFLPVLQLLYSWLSDSWPGNVNAPPINKQLLAARFQKGI